MWMWADCATALKITSGSSLQQLAMLSGHGGTQQTLFLAASASNRKQISTHASEFNTLATAQSSFPLAVSLEAAVSCQAWAAALPRQVALPALALLPCGRRRNQAQQRTMQGIHQYASTASRHQRIPPTPLCQSLTHPYLYVDNRQLHKGQWRIEAKLSCHAVQIPLCVFPTTQPPDFAQNLAPGPNLTVAKKLMRGEIGEDPPRRNY
jgi:hypothetical protein